ncbi:hypothetical protein ACJX0J_020660, partial [Zea mays]
YLFCFMGPCTQNIFSILPVMFLTLNIFLMFVFVFSVLLYITMLLTYVHLLIILLYFHDYILHLYTRLKQSLAHVKRMMYCWTTGNIIPILTCLGLKDFIFLLIGL